MKILEILNKKFNYKSLREKKLEEFYTKVNLSLSSYIFVDDRDFDEREEELTKVKKHVESLNESPVKQALRECFMVMDEYFEINEYMRINKYIKLNIIPEYFQKHPDLVFKSLLPWLILNKENNLTIEGIKEYVNYIRIQK